MIVDVIIPAYNEEESVGLVLNDIPKDVVRDVVVVNNNSSDKTPEVAASVGAVVVDQPIPGYGAACLKGIDKVKLNPDSPDVVVFLDADYSDYPNELPTLIKPIAEQNIDMVIGSRALGESEKGSMLPQQLFGNWLATRLMGLIYRSNFTDLGPFRAIKFDKLLALNMKDMNYGWTVEMQIKAVKSGLTYIEVPVSYRKRVGVSKITGTIKGTVMAGIKIISTIIKYR